LIKQSNSSLKNLWSRIDSYRNNCHFTKITAKSNSIQNHNSIKMLNFIPWKIILWSTAIKGPTPTHQWVTFREQDTLLWQLIEMSIGDHLDLILTFSLKEDIIKFRKILRIKSIFKRLVTIETSIQEMERGHCIHRRWWIMLFHPKIQFNQRL